MLHQIDEVAYFHLVVAEAFQVRQGLGSGVGVGVGGLSEG